MEEQRVDITWKDFETYLPQYDFDEQQMEFFKDTVDMLVHNRDTNKITALAMRCGIGKSTLIRIFMHCCLADCNYELRRHPQGMIVVTDIIKRLESLTDMEQDKIDGEKYWGDFFKDFGIKGLYEEFERSIIVLNSTEDFKDQLIRQKYKPIVLLSTQRYFMMSEAVREQLFTFTHNGENLKRDIVIFDEAPYFSEMATIDSNNLTKIEAALYEGLSNEVKDKAFAVREYKVFKDRLLDLMDEKEKLNSESNVIVYCQDKRYSGITPNDELFFKILDENSDSLTKQYPQIMREIYCLKEIAENGAVFDSVKKKYGNYERSFLRLKDNKDCFYLGQDRKFFVFDATADLDPRYDLDYVDVVTGDKYNKDINMEISFVNMSTSKNVLCRKSKRATQSINAAASYMKQKIKQAVGSHKDILVATYSDLVKRFEKDFEHVVYFGNIKGYNDYKDMYRMAHIGMNRFPNLAYYYMYCGCHPEEYDKLAEMSEEESLHFFDQLSKNHNKEYEDIITEVMLRCMLADFEQNIFRLAIRNFKNTDKVRVWVFCNTDDVLYHELANRIEKRYGPYGVKFTYEDAPEELQIEKVKDRKPPEGKNQTNAQKIIAWREKLMPGTEYKVKDLLEGTGLSNNQFQKVKSKNSVILNLINNDKTSKKGFYKVS